MSLDSSLKVKGALTRHRNVLTRAERVEKLKDEEKWDSNSSVLGLPKVGHRKIRAGRKEEKEAAATVPGTAAPGAAPAAAAAGAKASAGAKAPAAAAGAKPAAKATEKPGKK